MIHLSYKLNEENFKELNSYLSVHDRKTQVRLITILLSLIVFVIVMSYILFKLSFITLITSIIGIVLIIFIFPKIYWNMVFKRIDYFVDNEKIEYNQVEVIIDKDICVKDKSNKIRIGFNEIVNYDYTKNTCLIFYNKENKVNTLTIPIHAFTSDQLSEFHNLIMENKK